MSSRSGGAAPSAAGGSGARVRQLRSSLSSATGSALCAACRAACWFGSSLLMMASEWLGSRPGGRSANFCSRHSRRRLTCRTRLLAMPTEASHCLKQHHTLTSSTLHDKKLRDACMPRLRGSRFSKPPKLTPPHMRAMYSLHLAEAQQEASVVAHNLACWLLHQVCGVHRWSLCRNIRLYAVMAAPHVERNIR